MIETTADLRLAKVTGKTVFASDFRPAQLGWPADCRYALLLRASCVDRIFEGIALEGLSPENQPWKVVTAVDIESAGFENKGDKSLWFCKVGELAEYASQPVAILLFQDFLNFRRAAQEIREDRGIVKYGPKQQLPSQPSLTESLDAWCSLMAPADARPLHYLLSERVGEKASQWLHGAASLSAGKFTRPGPGGPPDPQALYEQLMHGSDPATVTTTTFTQQVDPAFMEPESGMAFLKDGCLHILTATQSPHGDAGAVKTALKVDSGSSVSSVEVTTVDAGGSFGGRDKAPFIVQLAFAAAFSDLPVRLAYDRFEQFQAGMKRHASGVRSRISALADGSLNQAVIHFVLEGGFEPNLGNAVLGLAALHGTGMYRFQEAGCHGIVTRKRVPIVGSMRGFGIPQLNFNIEIAIDKLAVLKVGVDPILFRMQNALQWNPAADLAHVDLAGTPLQFHVATNELCEIARAHPLWTEREERRAAKLKDGVYRGVGFAACIEAYGTSSDSVYAAIQLEADGTFTVWSETYDMGQGARRSIAEAATRVLRAPIRVSLGAQEPFEAFVLSLGPAVPKQRGASSASKTAFFHVHVLNEVSRLFVEMVVVPCVEKITGQSVSGADLPRFIAGGKLLAPDGRTLGWAMVAEELSKSGRPRFSIGHGLFANGWSSARLQFESKDHRAWLDALGLAVAYGSPTTLITRTDHRPASPAGPGKANAPRSGYAGGGHLVAVEINPQAGSIRVTDALAIVDAGDPLLLTQVEGQIEGGFQMGLAHALFEELPAETGEDRFVNFDRYVLPRASDLLDTKLEYKLIDLPSEGALNGSQPNVRHKGIAEVTMTTVAPALANAIAHALGHSEEAWPTTLPIRFEDLKLPKDTHA